MNSPAKVLADTNVWIAFFRGDRADPTGKRVAAQLDRFLVEDRVVLCGVVEMELIQGVRDNERELLEGHLAALLFLETDRDTFRQAGEVSKRLRQQGITIPSPDAMIAALCIRYDLMLLENDKHFATIGRLKRVLWRPDESE